MCVSNATQKGSDMHYAGLRKYDNRSANSERDVRLFTNLHTERRYLRSPDSNSIQIIAAKILYKANEKTARNSRM